jgi:chemotaxis protein methyltransferase CheR
LRDKMKKNYKSEAEEFSNKEDELTIAKEEKTKREAELAFANEEKAKRVAELVIADEERRSEAEKLKKEMELRKRQMKLMVDREPEQEEKIYTAKLRNKDTTELEISLLLEVVYQKYGYDFRQYSQAHIRRRITNRLAMSRLEDISQMQSKVLNDETFMSSLLQDLSITVTEMFRDPVFYKSLRENVIPVLKTYPFIKIWHAGCSTGEEAYSMAIILQEEGLYDRTTIYATDFNQRALNQAKQGIFSNKLMKEYTTNYQMSGGKESFSNYYTSDDSNVIMNQSLKKNIVWANHNLVTDSVFTEVHLILCRNVLIYFDKILQNIVQKLFYNSLIDGGILCLGSKESLRFSDFHEEYTELDKKQRIFKKKY